MTATGRLRIAAALLAGIVPAGCCGDDEGGGEGGDRPESITLVNETPWFVHAEHPGGPTLYVPPGEAAALRTEGDPPYRVEVFVAPGQVGQGSGAVIVTCCPEPEEDLCASAHATVHDGRFAVVTEVPGCGAAGSCPFVYAHDGRGWRPQGEALSGALLAGAERTDRVPLPDLRPAGGVARVRIATVLPEIDVIRKVALLQVDHAPGARLATDASGAIVAAAGRPPIGARDAAGVDRTAAVARAGGTAWVGDPGSPEVPRSERDLLHLRFAPPGARAALLVLRARNREWLQERYARYLADLGPGFPALLDLVDRLPWYRGSIERIARRSGLALEVRAGGRSVHVDPVGTLAAREVAVPIDGLDPAAPARVTLRALPRAWEIDRARLAPLPPSAAAAARIAPADARDPSGRPVAGLLAAGGGITQRAGETVELAFPIAGAPPAGAARSYALEVLGHYRIEPRGSVAVDYALLYRRAFSGRDAFARFARGAADEPRWQACPRVAAARAARAVRSWIGRGRAWVKGWSP